jgi:AbrB family looped-hinge helix DNA binding protein
MTYTSSVTQKGQITLPKNARDKLNIKTHQKVTIKVEKDHIKILPAEDILNIAGFLKDKVKHPANILDARDNFEKGYLRV